MNISWHGLSCFSIETKNSAKGQVKVLIDPYQNSTGLRFPRTMEADIVLSTHQEADADNVDAVGGNPFVISTPGEYEVKDIFIYGINAPFLVGKPETDKKNSSASNKKVGNTIYRLVVEEVTIAHLGALNRELTDEELSGLPDVDILMIPVGGGRVMPPKLAVKVIGQIDPRLVLPMSHAVPNLKEKFANVKDFCKEIGVCQSEATTKLKITRSALPEEETEIIVLSRA